jgi:hypothetical protein
MVEFELSPYPFEPIPAFGFLGQDAVLLSKI